MMPDIAIRRASPDDADLLAELGARTFADAFASDNTPEDMAAYLSSAFKPAQIASELADPKVTFYLAEVDGEIAGYTKLSAGKAQVEDTGDRPLELVRIYALQKWIGKGVGSALMQHCMEEGRQAGFCTLWLAVWKQNLRAQAFYTRWGFKIVGEQIFKLGSDIQMDWVMACELC